jgi:hypothetical protein
MVEGQPIHMCGEKIDELCNVSKTKGEGELVGCSLQQPIQ